MIKQNGNWKILSLTAIQDDEFNVNRIMSNMKVFVGKWVLDGTATLEPPDGSVLNAAEFVLWETPTGLEQTSKFTVTNAKGVSNIAPTAYEYFITDYAKGNIFYLNVKKNHAGQTFTETGTITSDNYNSFTMTKTYTDKPSAKMSEYTVTLVNGKWHQVGKRYDKNGNVTWTSSLAMRRL